MRNIFFFDSMLTPKIITFVYWFLLIFVIGFGLFEIFGGYSGVTFGKFLIGLGIIVGGAVFVRIWCELLIILFKIYKNIKNLASLMTSAIMIFKSTEKAKE
ncbi:MAG TPA: DUF4282 domain-containing protein [Smithellaceae bacterium]|nr:DUF4282 domain-containing protein [Smithellaceae bacterium]